MKNSKITKIVFIGIIIVLLLIVVVIKELIEEDTISNSGGYHEGEIIAEVTLLNVKEEIKEDENYFKLEDNKYIYKYNKKINMCKGIGNAIVLTLNRNSKTIYIIYTSNSSVDNSSNIIVIEKEQSDINIIESNKIPITGVYDCESGTYTDTTDYSKIQKIKKQYDRKEIKMNLISKVRPVILVFLIIILLLLIFIEVILIIKR